MKDVVNNSIQLIINTIKDSEINAVRKEGLISMLNNINYTAILTPSITSTKIKQLIPTLVLCGFNDVSEELTLLADLITDKYSYLTDPQIEVIGVILEKVHHNDQPIKKIESIAELCAYCPEAESLIQEHINIVTDVRINHICKDMESLSKQLSIIANRNNMYK